MDNERIHTGDIVQHFKRETLSPEDRNANKYLYKVWGVATHSETRRNMWYIRGCIGILKCTSGRMTCAFL